MDPELVAFLEERFTRLEKSTSEQIGSLREEILSRVETESWHTRILVDDLRSALGLLAEGFLIVRERMETFEERILKKELPEIRELMLPAYSELDRRVHALETWRETKERDPVDMVREMLEQGRLSRPID